MDKVIRMLIVVISFSIVLNAEMRLSERYGEYYDAYGRKLTIDKYGYGVLVEKGVQSERFQIGKSYSQKTNYGVTLVIKGISYVGNYLYFIDKENCVFVLGGGKKYYFLKDGHLKKYFYIK